MEQGDPGRRLAALAQWLPGLSGQQSHTNCTHTGLILTQLYTTAANTARTNAKLVKLTITYWCPWSTYIPESSRIGFLSTWGYLKAHKMLMSLGEMEGDRTIWGGSIVLVPRQALRQMFHIVTVIYKW